MSKAISKALLDEAIEQARHLYDLSVHIEAEDVHALMRAARAAFPSEGKHDYTMYDLLASIFRYNGLKPDGSNEDVYKVLEVLGWTVK